MTLPKTNLRQVYHVACTLGEVVNGKLETRLSKLCQSSKINPWSKNKPLLMTQEATDWVNNGGDLKDYSGNWQRGNLGTYGFNLPIGMSHDAIRAGANWDYAPPTGGTRQPFLLGFFAGYNPDAKPFMMTSIKKDDNEVAVNRTAQETYGFGAAIALSSEDQIGFDDFENSQIGESYFCVIMYPDSTYTSPTVVNADETISNGGSILRIDLTQPPFTIDRTWDCYLALRMTATSGTYYPIPWTNDNYYNLKLKLISESPFYAECTQFSGTYNRGYTDIRPYALSNVDPSLNKYYPTRGPLYFKVTMRTRGSSVITASRRQMTLEANSYFGTKESMTPVMYDSNFNAIDDVRVEPNVPVTVYIGSAYALNTKNGSSSVPPSDKKFYTLVAIKYRNENIFSTGLNVTSGV